MGVFMSFVAKTIYICFWNVIISHLGWLSRKVFIVSFQARYIKYAKPSCFKICMSSTFVLIFHVAFDKYFLLLKPGR